MASPHTQVLGSMKAGGVIHIPPPHGIPTRRMRKRANAVKNSETGKSKSLVPSPRQRTIARRSRSYKWKDYSTWCATFNGIKNLCGGKG